MFPRVFREGEKNAEVRERVSKRTRQTDRRREGVILTSCHHELIGSRIRKGRGRRKSEEESERTEGDRTIKRDTEKG